MRLCECAIPPETWHVSIPKVHNQSFAGPHDFKYTTRAVWLLISDVRFLMCDFRLMCESYTKSNIGKETISTFSGIKSHLDLPSTTFKNIKRLWCWPIISIKKKQDHFQNKKNGSFPPNLTHTLQELKQKTDPIWCCKIIRF